MKKVLHVVGQMTTGGMETLIMNLYRNMDREQVKFDILAYYTQAGEYDEEVRTLGGEVYVAAKSENMITFLRRIDAFFREHHDYEYIHVHTSWLGWIYFYYAHKYGIALKILHLHAFGSEHKGIKLLIRRKCVQYSIRRADAVFACSQRSAQYYNADMQKTRLLMNGIEVERFRYNEEKRNRLRRALGVEDKFVLVCVARFALQKNHKFLIDIMEKMKNYSEDIMLLLIGKGPLEQEIKDAVKSKDLESQVTFLGIRGDVNELLQAADCYVMPSIFEGLSLAYIEAQAAGLRTFISTEALAQEAQITDLLIPISLEYSADRWADIIWSNRCYERLDKKEEVLKGGFEIVDTARKLQKYYVEGENVFGKLEPM